MDTAEIFVTTGGLALIAFTLWFFFGRGEEAPVVARVEALCACPMHPWITSIDPTQSCSICGMKLSVRE